MPEIVGRLRPPRLASAPASPAVGEEYINTGTNLPMHWNGLAWISGRALFYAGYNIVSPPPWSLSNYNAFTAVTLPAAPQMGTEMLFWVNVAGGITVAIGAGDSGFANPHGIGGNLAGPITLNMGTHRLIYETDKYWRVISTTDPAPLVQATAPANAWVGVPWWDTTRQMLRVYDGAFWPGLSIPPASQNLLPNGSFERDTVGGATPVGWGVSGTFLTAGATASAVAGGLFGSNAMQIVTNGSNSQGANAAIAGTFQAGVPYIFSVWLKGSVGGEAAIIYMGNASEYTGQAITLTTSWQRCWVMWTPTAARTSVFVVVRCNAAVAVTFLADGARVAQELAPGSYVDGDSPGMGWVGSPGNSISGPQGPPVVPFVTTLPTNPVDGQECDYVADATNGLVWHLKYRAADTSAHKWQFIGGPDLQSGPGGNVTTSSTTLVAVGGVSVTIPVAGDYEVLFGMFGQSQGAGQVTLNTQLTKGGAGVSFPGQAVANNQYDGSEMGKDCVLTNLAAGDVLGLGLFLSGGTSVSCNFTYGWIRVKPRRIG